MIVQKTQEKNNGKQNPIMAEALRKREKILFRELLGSVLGKRDTALLKQHLGFFQKNWRSNTIELIKVTVGADLVTEAHLGHYKDNSELKPWLRLIDEYVDTINEVNDKVAKLRIPFEEAEKSPKLFGVFQKLRDIHVGLMSLNKNIREEEDAS